MKRELLTITRELSAWIAEQDENLLDMPCEADKQVVFAAQVESVEDLAAETEKNEAITAAEKAVNAYARSEHLEPKIKMTLDNLKETVSNCNKCPLGSFRLNPVFGVGNANAKIMFIGEGPGFSEDHLGEPFVGRSGNLLDKIMETVLGLNRADVYIANIVKCHPMKNPQTPEARSNDRPPTPEEINICKPYLQEQIKIIKPICIVPLGSVAAKTLLNTTEGISLLRGKVYDYVGCTEGIEHNIKVIPTYHPAALLRNPNLKRDTWYDMKLVKALLDSAH